MRLPLRLTTDMERSSALRPPPSALLTDTFGRRHNNLRVSVTDRCNLRCTYCMPEEVTFLDRSELLSFEEIAAFVRVAATLGVDKIRLTGGEPLMRKDLHKLAALARRGARHPRCRPDHQWHSSCRTCQCRCSTRACAG